MNFNRAATEFVEDEIGVDDEHAIVAKLGVTRNSTEMRMDLQPSDSGIEFVDEGEGSGGTIRSDPVVDRKQITLGYR